MTPKTKFEAFRRSLVALALTALVLPILGLWAVASLIEKMILKIKTRKGG